MQNQKNEVKSVTRANSLSFKKTNNVVKVHYLNEIRVYDNIHYPEAYITKLTQGGCAHIIAIELNGIFVDLKK